VRRHSHDKTRLQDQVHLHGSSHYTHTHRTRPHHTHGDQGPRELRPPSPTPPSPPPRTSTTHNVTQCQKTETPIGMRHTRGTVLRNAAAGVCVAIEGVGGAVSSRTHAQRARNGPGLSSRAVHLAGGSPMGRNAAAKIKAEKEAQRQAAGLMKDKPPASPSKSRAALWAAIRTSWYG
jgi:hypothetical protein